MTTASVVSIVSQVFGIPADVLVFRKKPTRDICRARRLSVALCYELMPSRTKTEIAKDFGWNWASAGREVSEAVEWVNDLLRERPDFKEKAIAVIKTIKTSGIK